MYHAAMPAGVRRFLPLQHLAVLATIDGDGRLWASLRSGEPGFLEVIDDQTLQIGGYGHPDDPLLANLAAHDALGVLVIDLGGRNRCRLNGMAQALPDGAILLATKQVCGNCRICLRECDGISSRRSAMLHPNSKKSKKSLGCTGIRHTR
jgi:predicted pyridoxine 5'-phosphate oxidase superfamily flavin-nucleotide-binding protein